MNDFFNKVDDFFKFLEVEEKSSKKQRLEKEMDDYNLEENEKELVRDGLYDPWDFNDDKDDMEEDDYYSDDF